MNPQYRNTRRELETEEAFAKVYGVLCKGSYEAVVAECQKLVDACQTCAGTGVEAGKLCSRCTDARYALKNLEGVTKPEVAASMKDILKEEPGP